MQAIKQTIDERFHKQNNAYFMPIVTEWMKKLFFWFVDF